jgi:UPF0716 protein FxsA
MRLGFAGIIAVAIPALEIVGIYLVGSRFGLGPTLLWLLTAVLFGIFVIRQERATFLPRLQQALAQGEPPFALLWASGRRFLAGVLLIVPGPFSDLVALPLLLWPRPRLPRAAMDPEVPPAARQGSRGTPGDVIEGEYRRED